MCIRDRSPTQLSLPSISLDRHEEMSLLMGMEHKFSFTLQDANGLESIDSIVLDIAGDGQGVIFFHPLNGTLSSDLNCPVVPLSVDTESLGDNAYLIEISFAINFGAPEEWLQGQWIPSLQIVEDGEDVSGSVSNLDHLVWALDNRLMWRVDAIEDLTTPSMPMFENKLNLQPGDSMSFTASIVHRELNQTIAIGIPQSTEIEINILGGEDTYTVYSAANGGGFTVVIDFDVNLWNGPTHTIQFGLANHTGLNTSLPDMAFDVAIDSIAPKIEFQTTSLVQLRSDALSNQLVSFTVEDEGGMGDQSLVLHWVFRRDGLDISGSKSSMDMGLGVHSNGLWVYSSYVNLTPNIRLIPGDILMVWVEGKDLAGNELQGPGTENSPRVPALEIMHFTPNLISIWVDNDAPEVGDIIQVDTRIHNIGNLPGHLNVSLWAWEPQPNAEPLIIEFESQEVSLDARQSILLRFEFEAWREGDLQLYLILNDDENSRIPIDLAPIREEGASLSWVERVFGDGPIVVSILILLCTALGFGTAMLWLREEEGDEWDEQLHDETDSWPTPPEHFPDEKPPPIPQDLLDVHQEEE